MNLDAKIEAILFWKGEPVKIKKLVEIFNLPVEEIENGIKVLETKLIDRGLILQRLEDEVALATQNEIGGLIENLTKEELKKDLGKAGLETLTIILYKGPVRRSEIDYIRGVNSQFILRNLLIRGLIERVSDPKDERSYLYKPTFDLISHLGISRLEDLPEYQSLRNKIEENSNDEQL